MTKKEYFSNVQLKRWTDAKDIQRKKQSIVCKNNWKNGVLKGRPKKQFKLTDENGNITYITGVGNLIKFLGFKSPGNFYKHRFDKIIYNKGMTIFYFIEEII